MKKPFLTAAQIAITLGILWFVFRDPTKRAEMLATLHRADRGWLLLGFASYGLVEIGAGLRWLLLLRVQGIHLGALRLSALLLIGVFFNFFIPGGTGGDVVKTFYLMKETPGRRTAALLSVLVDRLAGLMALIVLAGGVIALRWHWLTASAATARAVWTTLAILGAGLAGILFSFLLSGLGLVHRLPPRFPLRDRFAELALAYNLYGRAWPSTLGALALSFPTHLCYFAVFYCAAASFGASGVRIPSLGELMSVMPVVNTITSMPISLGGIGVREGLFQIFLGHLCGVSEAVAVLISSTGYLLSLFWGICGGLVYLLYRPSEHARLREIREEVASAEHAVAEEEIAREEG